MIEIYRKIESLYEDTYYFYSNKIGDFVRLEARLDTLQEVLWVIENIMKQDGHNED